MSFASCVSSLQADHRSAAAALARASSALSSYASVLAECQAAVKAAQGRVAEAQASASSAMTRLDSQPVSVHDPGAAAARAYAEANIQSTTDQEIGLAVSAGQAAWDRFEAAAARTAAQIGSAIPSWSSVSKELGWLNDKAGFGLVPLGLGFLVPLARAGVRWADTSGLIQAARPIWTEDPANIPQQEAYPYLYSQSEDVAARLFQADGVQVFGSGGLDDLPFAAQLAGISRVLAGASVASDVAEIISPDDSGAVRAFDRGMAAANGVVSGDALLGGAGSEALGGALGVTDVATSWIPVAGQVVLAGTALYLAGDWAYNNVKWFHDGVDDVGHGLEDAGKDVLHFFGL